MHSFHSLKIVLPALLYILIISFNPGITTFSAMLYEHPLFRAGTDYLKKNVYSICENFPYQLLKSNQRTFHLKNN